jgi:hypothetical protein
VTVKYHLAVRLDRERFAPGEQVTGRVEVVEEAKGRELTVALEYRDWTSDYRSISRSVPLATPLGVGDLQAGASFPFSLALPADAAPEHTGVNGAVSWGIHAHLERFGPDFHAWHVIQVATAAPAGR